MNILEKINKHQKYVNIKISEIFDKEITKASEISPSCVELVKAVRDFITRSAKRLRPYLVILGYKAFGGKEYEEVKKASIASELIHNYLLIHDDIIDRDEKRRGGPTVHKFIASKYQDEHIGTSYAILAGDLVCVLAYQILAETNFQDIIKIKAIKKLNNILADVVYGEQLDIFYSKEKKITPRQVIKVLEYKTGRYTIDGPLEIGGILAGAKKTELGIFSKYGQPVGVAFQIIDDILGIYGDPKDTGKSAHSDLLEGKKTLLISYALQRAGVSDKKRIIKVLGNRNATFWEIEKVKGIIRDCGAKRLAQDYARSLAEKGKRVIIHSKFQKDIKQEFIDLAEYIIMRIR